MEIKLLPELAHIAIAILIIAMGYNVSYQAMLVEVVNTDNEMHLHYLMKEQAD